MVTTEERITSICSQPQGHVPVIELVNKTKTRKEIEHTKNAIKKQDFNEQLKKFAKIN
jgi:hypothetical protein